MRRGESAVPRRRGSRDLHVRGRGVRVHRQPRVRAAQPRRARPRRDHLDHQRVRARRLRHGRHAPEAGRLRHPEQHLQRVPVRRARDRLDHARARPQGRARPRSLRDGGRHRGRAGVRLRDAAAAVLGRRPEGLRPRRRRHHRPPVPPQRIHARRRRLHAQAARALESGGLAAHLPVAGVQQRVRGRDRVRAAARDLHPSQEPQRHGDRPGAAADRDAVGDDRQGGRPQHRRHDRRRRGRRPTPPRWPRWAPRASPPPAPTRSRAPPPR